MPRRRTATAAPVESELPGLDDLAPDPVPTALRGRAPRASTPAKRGPGRPRGTGPRTAGGRLMSKDAMRAKVAAELYTYLSLFAAGWELRDPQCAQVLFEPVVLPTDAGPVESERLQAIVDRLVAIISRNNAVLETLAKSGVIGELAILGHLMFPIVKAVWQAHGPAGIGHATPEEAADAYAQRYPAVVR